MIDSDGNHWIDWNWVVNSSNGWSDSRWVVVDGEVVTDLQEDK